MYPNLVDNPQWSPEDSSLSATFFQAGSRGKKCKMVTELLDAKSVLRQITNEPPETLITLW